MSYSRLKEFVVEKMRMSHIYQPVMLRFLLGKGGKATAREIAIELLKYDPSQIEYYENITKNMVGKVLRSHKLVDKKNTGFELVDFATLTEKEVQNLMLLCEQKVDEYIEKRGIRIWEHRRTNRCYIPGSIKYQVLKRAQGRCELCGISYIEKALEVDHIVPKNLGGEDSINNYQALCYSCNASKRDTDSTDFRNLTNLYSHRQDECLFCSLPHERVITENNLAFVIKDGYPVTEGHRLIIPKRHFSDYFEIKQAETNAVNQLLNAAKEEVKRKDSLITGFNIGINSGKAAGQTIHHCHIHLIPRRDNDVENPRGGIRHVIPGKGFY